jgi:hypothetical protein
MPKEKKIGKMNELNLQIKSWADQPINQLTTINQPTTNQQPTNNQFSRLHTKVGFHKLRQVFVVFIDFAFPVVPFHEREFVGGVRMLLNVPSVVQRVVQKCEQLNLLKGGRGRRIRGQMCV